MIDFEEEIGRVVRTIENSLLNRAKAEDMYISESLTDAIGDVLSNDAELKERLLPIIKFDFLVFSLWMEEALKVEDGRLNSREKIKNDRGRSTSYKRGYFLQLHAYSKAI